MKEGLTEIVCVLDRSGSMNSIITEAIGGFNTFLDEQKKLDGEAKLTVALFDDHYDLIHDNVDINTVEDISPNVFFPRGMTALHDAIGKTVTTVGQRLAVTDESERPEKIVVAILTDGMENKSTEYTAQMIKEMIEHQEEKYDWRFVYLAANQDAFDVGATFGMKSVNSLNFNANRGGARGAMQNISSVTTSYRKMSKNSSTYSTEDVMKMASASLKDADGN